MRRLHLLLVPLLAVLVAGCGGGTTTVTHTVTIRKLEVAPHARCVGKYPPAMGETERLAHCEEGRLGFAAPAPLAAASRPQGIDISRWQPHPRFGQLYREGIRFVIIQSNAGGCTCNPFFSSQVHEAHAAGMKIGVYVFVEPGASAATQAAVLRQVVGPLRGYITAGAWVDAEVPGAYTLACPIVAGLGNFFHRGVYSSTGLWPGFRCRENWPAKWGGLLEPLPGYPFSAIAMRQWCGTCRLGGNDGEIDRDEWVKGPLPGSAATKAQQRVHAEHEAAVLRGDLHRHGCFHVHGKRAFQLCPRWGGLWRHWEGEVRQLRR